MKEMILDALVVEPGMMPYEEYIVNDLEMIQFFLSEGESYSCRVGVLKLYDGVGIVYNLDAEKYNLRPNRQMITGTFYVVGIDKEKKITSLTANDKQKYYYKFRNI